MQELLIGLVPGLPPSLRAQILARAEGVPLYAVETVRMLLDRGLLVEDGSAYKVVGEIGSLDVPETLQALVAARLDGLASEERRLVQDAAVVGKTFTHASLAALTGQPEAELEPLLAGLVRKELLGVQTDPRSPEHGQYGFLQDIVRRVAYETLPKRERRAKHLAAAEHLAVTLGEEEVAEVVASHLLEAYRLDPDAPEAESLRTHAYTALLRAGERAASLGASIEAQRYFEQAAELAAEPTTEAAALMRAGEMTALTGDAAGAEAAFARAVSLYEASGDTHAAGRATAWLAYAEQLRGDAHGAVERMERAYEVIGEDEPDADLALLLTRLGSAHFFAGNLELAMERTEQGLEIAEALRLPEMLVRGWSTKATITAFRKPQEARALLQLALDTASAYELPAQVTMQLSNLSDLGFQGDRYAESLGYLSEALEEHAGLGAAATSGSRSPKCPTHSRCSAAGTRLWPASATFPTRSWGAMTSRASLVGFSRCICSGVRSQQPGSSSPDSSSSKARATFSRAWATTRPAQQCCSPRDTVTRHSWPPSVRLLPATHRASRRRTSSRRSATRSRRRWASGARTGQKSW